MRNIAFSIAILFALLTASVYSAEMELDTDLMHAIEDTNKSLAANIAAKDVKASTVDAKELDALFAHVETFFVNRGGADDAVALSRKIKELSSDIAKSVAAKDFDSATTTATTLSRTCKTCHNFYKKS